MSSLVVEFKVIFPWSFKGSAPFYFTFQFFYWAVKFASLMDFSIFLYYVGGVVLNFTICLGMYLFLFTIEIAWFGNSVSGVNGAPLSFAVQLP